jgi:Fe-S-cluster-containing dehydrogenase component
MVEYALLFDIRRCIGCYACEIACKQENDLPVGPRLIRVITIGPRMVGEKLSMDYVPVACIQCGKPDCMDVCPKKAITKRPDGIVVINEELCSGCKLCIQACPLGVMQFNPAKNVAVKCTMCPGRIEKGLKPSCVQHCPAEAIRFGDINELTEVVRKNYAAVISTAAEKLPHL